MVVELSLIGQGRCVFSRIRWGDHVCHSWREEFGGDVGGGVPDVGSTWCVSDSVVFADESRLEEAGHDNKVPIAESRLTLDMMLKRKA